MTDTPTPIPARPARNTWYLILLPVAIIVSVVALSITANLIVYYSAIMAAPPCNLRTTVGIPCPACGGTRSMACLTRYDLLASATYNPAVPFSIIALLLVTSVNGLGLLLRGRQVFRHVPRAWFWFAMLMLNWIYLMWASSRGML